MNSRTINMIIMDNPERKCILKQVLDARTLPEIDAATETLRAWVRRNPADVGIVEAFEGLSLLHDIAEEQEAERVHPEPLTAGPCLKVRRVRCGARRDVFNGRYTAKITQ